MEEALWQDPTAEGVNGNQALWLVIKFIVEMPFLMPCKMVIHYEWRCPENPCWDSEDQFVEALMHNYANSERYGKSNEFITKITSGIQEQTETLVNLTWT